MHIFFAACIFASAQKSITDSVFSIQDIDIAASRQVLFSTGNRLQYIQLSSNTVNNSLAEVLQNTALLNVKSYGYGGLTSISVRGTNASNTAVLWQGFNLQNPMNGGFDFSSLPAFLFDNVHIQYGGSSALFGSGAAGGVISFENHRSFGDGFIAKVATSVGSFQNFSFHSHFCISKKKYISSIKIVNSSAKNDFEYRLASLGTKRQQNAATNLNGINVDNIFKINKKQQIGVYVWWQNSFRQIPPNMSISQSNASDNNQFVRLSADWQYVHNRASVTARAAYFNDIYSYSNPLTKIESHLQSVSYLSEIEAKISASKHLLMNMGLGNSYEKALTNNYNFAPTRNHIYLFASTKLLYFNQKLRFTTSFRQEATNLQFQPTTFGFSASFQPNQYNVYASLSKNYRLPTLNDLYWIVGGNEHLLSEMGFSKELGVSKHWLIGNWKLENELTFFENNMSNQIVWTPNGAFWQAENKQKVVSRGWELGNETQFNIQSVEFKIHTQYHFLKSIITKSFDKLEVGKQLIYQPNHRLISTIVLKYNDFNLSYHQQLNGKRFVLLDNSVALPMFTTANLSISKSIKYKKFTSNLSFEIQNIWNAEYQLMQWYAMPLRNFSISVLVKFCK